MNEKTRSAILNKDANRMGEPTLQGASAIPRAKLHDRDLVAEREAAMDAVISRAMAKVAAEEQEAKVEDADAIRQRLFNQVAGHDD